MKTNENIENRKLNIFIQVCGLLTVLLGLFAILGWVFDIQELASFAYGKIPMALSTAALFVAFGLIIFIYHRIISNAMMFQVVVVVSCSGVKFNKIQSRLFELKRKKMEEVNHD